MLGQVNSNVSAIQLLNAANAFRNVKATTPVEPQLKEPETSNGIDLADNDILKSQNVDEIKKYAQMMQSANEEALTDDDIKYGLSYGRSVIVEYLA